MGATFSEYLARVGFLPGHSALFLLSPQTLGVRGGHGVRETVASHAVLDCLDLGLWGGWGSSSSCPCPPASSRPCRIHLGSSFLTIRKVGPPLLSGVINL